MNIIESTHQFSLLPESDIKTIEENTNINEKRNCIKIRPDSIFIRTQDYFRKVEFYNILYVEANGSYCIFHLQTGSKLTVSYTLTEATQHLSEFFFIRVHRSFIINIKHVSGFIGNTFYIGEQMIPIGRLYKKKALSHFNVLGTIS